MDASTRTIFAVATGAGRAAIVVLRLSGPGCAAILERLCRGRMPSPRRASLRRLWRHDDLLDRALVLWFPAPESYTGEDGGELHLHAGPAVLEAVAEALLELGAVPAEAGEFTRRAFRNGRLDLLEAEGIADLVEAETQAQRRQALRQSEGALSTLYQGWAERLRLMLAQQEALIDFPDEALPPEVEALLQQDMAWLQDEIGAYLAAGGPGERLRRGLVFAVIGAPNVGKSSLVNALARREAAIVSAQAGTTRDAIEIRIVLADVPVTLVDTAGLRETVDPVEAEGVRRARLHAAQADLTLRVVTTGQPHEQVEGELIICNKIDQAPGIAGAIGVSARTGAGLDALRALLSEQARSLTRQAGAVPLTRARHRLGLQEAHAALLGAASALWPELRAEELRLALHAIGRLTGAIGVEELLDTVFGQFCIGK